VIRVWGLGVRPSHLDPGHPHIQMLYGLDLPKIVDQAMGAW